MIHDLDDEVIVNRKAKPMYVEDNFDFMLGKDKSRLVLFPPFKGELCPNLSLPSIKSKSFSTLVLPSHFRSYQEHVSLNQKFLGFFYPPTI